MRRRDGFTLIELLVTIAIMGTLLTILVINLRSSLPNARDEKRRSDIDTIARGLESRYANGNPRATSSSIEKGAYPGTNEMLHAMGQSQVGFDPTQILEGYLPDLLPGTTKEVFIPPNNGTFVVICSSSCQPAETTSVVETATTISKYVYEPIDASGNVCSNSGCVRYNLYYRNENTGIVQKVKSRNQ